MAGSGHHLQHSSIGSRSLTRSSNGMSDDSASAYEKHARAFLSARDRTTTGTAVVERWARSINPGTEVLEIGCGGGFPVTRVLVDAGLKLWAVDSSPTLLSEFRARFPEIPVECARASQCSLFWAEVRCSHIDWIGISPERARASGPHTTSVRAHRPGRSTPVHRTLGERDVGGYDYGSRMPVTRARAV